MKTSELTGAALDWAVAKCEGVTEGKDSAWYYDRRDAYNYSTDWAQGGPIISRLGIDLHHCQNGEGKYETLAQLREHRDPTGKLLACAWSVDGEGPDRDLIAAMRCYVASKLGAEVVVPEELK